MQPALVLQPTRRPVLLRDVVFLMFRHKWLLATSFFTIVLVAVGSALMLPLKYESSIKLLVQRERANIPISPGRDDVDRGPAEEISEAEMNSELELLRTDDILRNVVLQTGLAGDHPSSKKIDLAAARLKSNLHIEPINKSDIIGATYRSTDPQLSAKVLNTLVTLYFEKHLQVSRQTGELEFFDRQAEHYKRQLEQVEKKLAASHIVSAQLSRDKMVDKVGNLKAAAAETEAAIAETEKRIASLKDLETRTPERLVTEKRTEDNPQLLQTMKSTLLTLQLSRDQLLAKYQPDYRPVLDINKSITDTQAAIALEESRPIRQETTNQNTAFEWIRTELARAEADLQGLRGRERADSRILASDDQDLHSLNADGIEEQDLLREVKAAEDNYLLYSQKREEARISGELDEKRIVNVVVVQSPSVPATHVHQRKKLVMLGVIAAVLLSLVLVLVADFFNPRFRSLHELTDSLDLPVLAAIPSPNALSRLNLEARQQNGFPQSNGL
jgi:uncharacterized protein involved in exopolysaccharide biosynthesis